MNAISREQADNLLVYLDCEAMHLERVLAFLNEFRGALIRRDCIALEQMREEMEQEGQTCSVMDARRRRLVEEIAGVLGCRAEEVCLSRIVPRTDPLHRAALRQRQEHLKELTERLRQQHLSTELLVREYARMNRRLLETVTGQGEQGRVYDAHGRSDGITRSGLVSVKM